MLLSTVLPEGFTVIVAPWNNQYTSFNTACQGRDLANFFLSAQIPGKFSFEGSVCACFNAQTPIIRT